MFKPAELVSNPGILKADDRLDWSTIDSQSDLCPEFPPPFPEFDRQLTFESDNKQKIEVSVPQGKIVRVNQNHFFPGTFDIGEKLLFTGFGNPGALCLKFARTVSGVGLNIQSDPQVSPHTPPPFPFTAIVDVFDLLERSLGKFVLPGLSKVEAGTGTTFIGLHHEQGQIAKVTIEVMEDGVSIPFAINSLRLKTCKSVPAVGFRSVREYMAHFS